MGRAWSYLERLSRYPHRGVGTPQEAAAASEAAGWLTGMGYRVEIQPFRAPRDTLYLGPVVLMLGYLLAALLGWLGWAWPALLLCLLLLLPLVGEMRARGVDFDLWLRLYPSQNVVARTAPVPGERLHLVICGHLDTQKATYLFHPRFRPWVQPYFSLVYGSLLLVVTALAARAALPQAAWPLGLLGAGCGLVAVHLAFLLTCALTGRWVNGANDNGTGAALVLALAEHFARRPLPGVGFTFLLTGAEEVGCRGMKRYLRTAGHDPATTSFINLDNLGGGTLHYLGGEGMTLYYRYGPGLVALAAQMAAEQPGRVAYRKNLLLPTDALVPAAAGFPAISFLAFDQTGSPTQYHWHTDTLAHVDRELVEFTERFLVEYVGRLAGAPVRA